MANSLDMDLTGKIVIFKQQYLRVPAKRHPFRVLGGNGSRANAAGTALGGKFISDGEAARMEGYMVARLATEEEIKAAEEGG